MEKESQIKLVSNCPVADEERYGVYAETLHEKIKDKSVSNIGIIAPFGAGKSSLIKTYKDKFLIKREAKKVATISLANFNVAENKVENDESVCITDANNVDERDVEKSILEQVLFRVDKSKVPNSKINRIDNHHFIKTLFITLIFVVSALMITSTILEHLMIFPNSDGSKFNLFFSLSAISLLLLVFFLIYTNRLNKIAVKDIEADFNSDESGSILNKFIDEIIYYFAKTKVAIVVIEDLDRFNNLNLFSKLREINFLINNSEQVKQKVTFIYAVKDDLFQTDVERAKFFDFIISLIPILSFTNSRDIIKKEMAKTCSSEMSLPEAYIYEISHFIKDMRILKNIINDYIMFYNVLNIGELHYNDKNVKLFSLMVYKNLRPDDYALLQFGEGVIANQFKGKEILIEKEISEKNSELNVLKEKRVEAENCFYSSFEMLKNSVLGYILKSGGSYSRRYKEINNLQTFKDVVDGLSYNKGNGYYCNSSLVDIENYLGKSLIDYEEDIENRFGQSKENLDKKIASMEDSIRIAKNYTMKEYLESDNSLLKGDELIRFLLGNGYIDESYNDYITHSDKELISNKDQLFIRKVLSKMEIDVFEKLDKPIFVIKDIAKERFLDKYILNISLVKELLSYSGKDKDIVEKRKNFTDYFSDGNWDDNKIRFVESYINSEIDIKLLINELIKRNKLLAYIILNNDNIDTDKKNKVLHDIFSLNNVKLIQEQNHENVISNYIKNHNNPIEKFSNSEKIIEIFVETLKTLNICIKSLNIRQMKDVTLQKKCIELVIKKCLYELNLANIKFLLTAYLDLNYEDYVTKLLTTLLTSNKDYITNYIRANLELVVKIVVGLGGDFVDSEETIKEIILSDGIETSIKQSFIDCQKDKINYYQDINNEISIYLLEKNKIIATWENVLLAKDKIDFENIVNFIVLNKEKLSKDSLEEKTFILSLCNDVDYGDLTIIEELSKSFRADIKVNEILKDEISAILVKNDVIDCEVQNLVLSKNRVETALSIIIKNPELIESVDWEVFDRELITKLILSDNLSNSDKNRLINRIQDYFSLSSVEEAEAIAKAIIMDKLDTCSNRLLDLLTKSDINYEFKISLMEIYGISLPESNFIKYMKNIEPSLSELDDVNETSILHHKYDKKLLKLLVDKNIFKMREYKAVIRLKRLNTN